MTQRRAGITILVILAVLVVAGVAASLPGVIDGWTTTDSDRLAP
jgi:phosphoribosylcarboxyaminoimidazole (NCAIR) mutase